MYGTFTTAERRDVALHITPNYDKLDPTKVNKVINDLWVHRNQIF